MSICTKTVDFNRKFRKRVSKCIYGSFIISWRAIWPRGMVCLGPETCGESFCQKPFDPGALLTLNFTLFPTSIIYLLVMLVSQSFPYELSFWYSYYTSITSIPCRLHFLSLLILDVKKFLGYWRLWWDPGVERYWLHLILLLLVFILYLETNCTIVVIMKDL